MSDQDTQEMVTRLPDNLDELPEAIRGGVSKPSLDTPANVPVLPRGNDAVVHVECGVPITFNVKERQFEAVMNQGRDEARLHSTDFDALLDRIRQRALIEPVVGYVIHRTYTSLPHPGSGKEVDTRPRWTAEEVRVVEFHKGRVNPYLVQHVKNGQRSAHTVEEVYFLTDENVAALKALSDEIIHEEQDHLRVMNLLKTRERDLFASFRAMTDADVRRIQKTGRQLSEPGLVSFEAEPDHDDEAGDDS